RLVRGPRDDFRVEAPPQAIPRALVGGGDRREFGRALGRVAGRVERLADGAIAARVDGHDLLDPEALSRTDLAVELLRDEPRVLDRAPIDRGRLVLEERAQARRERRADLGLNGLDGEVDHLFS